MQAPAPHPTSRPRRAPVRDLFLRARHLSVALLLLATLIVVSLINPRFATLENFRDLLVQAAPIMIIGCGMTLVVLTGEIDISVGSLYGLLAALMSIFSSPTYFDLPLPLVIAGTLLAGAAIGFLNALLVAVARVPSIIATLGMLTILRGVTEVIMRGEWTTDLPPGLRVLGTGSLLGVPLCVLAAALVALVSLLLARRTRMGLAVYAVGGNADAATFARISPVRVKMFAFTFTGLLTAVAVLVAVPQLGVVESGIGIGVELIVVTAVLVGGTSISGGRGGIVGTLIAALLICSIRTILVFLQLGDMFTYWERAIQGAFILTAVLVDHLSAPRSPRHQGAPA